MRFATALIVISAAVCVLAAPIHHVTSHPDSDMALQAAHVHNSVSALHEHNHSLQVSHGEAGDALQPRSLEHMNELEARSGKKHRHGKHGKHGKHKKHGKHGKHKKHHKKHRKGGKARKAQMQAQ
ncbi:hypothetical protein M408DRAFT_263218 [Serendipita vermifera MAFF 305830]|uniref:Uncharacterized protein n=1 Tax=Serendipita vermifera MAFF 305830 TaxID=933852 RepID=A0A0C3ATS8_SERVB|nr:hypothetical protein M408DRAFT_263218 [Serendipita vermifera MAFF 305830]